jgi:late competence protein required for DNA uptake (superfamily II DNA/RNA helicase)
VVEPRLQVQTESQAEFEKESDKAVKHLENEIECPRCHDDMTLCSEFDALYYFCEECDFCLFTLKKG